MSPKLDYNTVAGNLALRIAGWVPAFWAVVFLASQAVFAWVMGPNLPASIVLHVGTGADVARNAIVLDSRQLITGGWVAAVLFCATSLVVFVRRTTAITTMHAVFHLFTCTIAPMSAGILLGSGMVSIIDTDRFTYDLLPAMTSTLGLALGIFSTFVLPRSLADRLLRDRSA